MATIRQELSIRGESVQRVYSFYLNNSLVVNRKYQRKLVWNMNEKKAFIDSLLLGYPVPLFLFAENDIEGKSVLEIIDGMQRLNSITSFMEQDFSVNEGYFDLETIPETKLLIDKGFLTQKYPKLDRERCAALASYLIPFSTYRINKSEEIDEIFRRINSGGRQLSRQDIRQSGSICNFASVVRKISAKIRGDDSAKDILLLNQMKNISISNDNLPYGLNVDDIFWVRQSILPREKVRESRDEEMISDILAYCLLDDKPYSSKDLLDSYYGIFSSQINEERYSTLESKIQKDGQEIIIKQFIIVFDEIRKILEKTDKQFNKLMFRDAGSNVPRYFQSIFIALYELIIKRNLKVTDYGKLVKNIDGIGSHINVGTGAGGVWTSSDRINSVNAVVGIIEHFFEKKTSNDPAVSSWTTELENILMQSKTEQTMYDFKQGYMRLNNNEFDQAAFSKSVKTMTAIANSDPNSIGYVIIGVADDKQDADTIKVKYSIEYVTYSSFFLVGIDNEASILSKNLDEYFRFVSQKLSCEPISKEFISQLSREVRIISYYSKSILVFRITSNGEPVMYNNELYERQGNKTEVIPQANYNSFYKRFYHKKEN